MSTKCGYYCSDIPLRVRSPKSGTLGYRRPITELGGRGSSPRVTYLCFSRLSLAIITMTDVTVLLQSDTQPTDCLSTNLSVDIVWNMSGEEEEKSATYQGLCTRSSRGSLSVKIFPNSHIQAKPGKRGGYSSTRFFFIISLSVFFTLNKSFDIKWRA